MPLLHFSVVSSDEVNTADSEGSQSTSSVGELTSHKTDRSDDLQTAAEDETFSTSSEQN